MNTTCSRCGWSNARISAPSSILDWLLKPFFVVPVRCRSCRARFYRFSTQTLEHHPMSDSQRAAFVSTPVAQIVVAPQPKVEEPVRQWTTPVGGAPLTKMPIKRAELKSSYRSMYIAAHRREMDLAVKAGSVWFQNSVSCGSQSVPCKSDVSRSLTSGIKRPTVWARTCPEKV